MGDCIGDEAIGLASLKRAAQERSLDLAAWRDGADGNGEGPTDPNWVCTTPTGN